MYLLLIPVGLLIGVPLIVALLVMPQRALRQRSIVYWLLDKLYRSLLRITLIPQQWHGTATVPDEPAIVVANHQSSLDILVVGSLLSGAPHVWYALAYYADHPILGFLVRRIGIQVPAEKASASAKSLLRGIKMLQGDPRYVIIFPEGGRYPEPDIRTFHKGFAVLARQTGRSVIPVYMPKNGYIYGPEAYMLHWSKLHVYVGTVFTYQENETDEAFVARVRAWFVQQAEEWT